MEQPRLRPSRSSITLPPLFEKKAMTNDNLPQINNNNYLLNNNEWYSKLFRKYEKRFI